MVESKYLGEKVSVKLIDGTVYEGVALDVICAEDLDSDEDEIPVRCSKGIIAFKESEILSIEVID